MKILYVPKKFNEKHTEIVERANTIIDLYHGQGYDLTLRQLYYQFVTRNWLVNSDKSYNLLGNVVSDARRAGRIDWDRIVDRTRNVRHPPAWDGPSHIINAVSNQFDIDWWANQPYRPEVWIEKDALVGVLEVACADWHCPYFSCRGYTSDSEIWAAAQRLAGYMKNDQTPIVFHLGDHDPSGIDMSRDIKDRLKLFSANLNVVHEIEVRRIALTMPQIEEVNPPANPAKTTDGRYKKYQEEYGEESWELDALSPTYITDLIATHMNEIVEPDEWAEAQARRDEGRRLLRAVSKNWQTLTKGL